jgi:hypothetical protein
VVHPGAVILQLARTAPLLRQRLSRLRTRLTTVDMSRHADMSAPETGISTLLVQYDQYWLDHVARLEHKAQLLHTLKQGMELLLLVCSYLFFYLIDCISQVMSMPIVR